MSKIVRVFPRRTSYTPRDPLSFVGDPPLFRPSADEVHISVSFTWDLAEAARLRGAWAHHYDVVKVGGPALGQLTGKFVAGRYVKPGVTFTTRGCNRRCPWCFVPEREGRLRHADFPDGWIIQDNNFLQAGQDHQDRVFAMLARQPKPACFAGGIDARLVDERFSDRLRRLTETPYPSGRRRGLPTVFLAADTRPAVWALQSAIEHLGWLTRRNLRVYTLIGFGNDTPAKAQQRLRGVWNAGGLPFAQLYQPPDRFIRYGWEWRALRKAWSRPASIKAIMAG